MAVYHVYILASASGVLYAGVTNFLERRMREHKQKLIDGFTKKYDVTRLVYFEPHGQPKWAIQRGKQIKSWRREKKLDLIGWAMLPRSLRFVPDVRAARTKEKISHFGRDDGQGKIATQPDAPLRLRS